MYTACFVNIDAPVGAFSFLFFLLIHSFRLNVFPVSSFKQIKPAAADSDYRHGWNQFFRLILSKRANRFKPFNKILICSC